MDQAGAGGLDQVANAVRSVRGELVEDDHIAGAKLRPEALLDVRLEGPRRHRSVAFESADATGSYSFQIGATA